MAYISFREFMFTEFEELEALKMFISGCLLDPPANGQMVVCVSGKLIKGC